MCGVVWWGGVCILSMWYCIRGVLMSGAASLDCVEQVQRLPGGIAYFLARPSRPPRRDIEGMV